MAEEKKKPKDTSNSKKTDTSKPKRRDASKSKKIDAGKTKGKTKPKDDLFSQVKKELDTAKKIISTYAQKIGNIEVERDKIKNDLELNVETFKIKAKEFAKEAQEQINNFKEEHKTKVEKETEHFKKYASQDFVKDLIEPLINFRLAVESGKKNDNHIVSQFVIGFDMLLNQIDDILENYGVTKIEPKIGSEFLPEIHHAIKSEKGKLNKIIEVKKNGYKYHDRIIKPAMVIIGNGK